MPTGTLEELLISLAVAWILLTVVRFLDVNEREPVWSLASMFALGTLAALALPLVVSSVTVLLDPIAGAVAEEGAKFIGLLAGIGIFTGVARVRGWSEFSDLTDGIVYGIAIGLGFSTGQTLIRELASRPDLLSTLGPAPWQVVVTSALGGLSHGVFAALTGLGFGAAVDARGRLGRSLYPALGLGAAIVANGGFRVLAHGNALGGQAGLVRAWLAVVLPLAAIVALWIYSLGAERRAIHRELTDEVAGGVLTDAELSLLESFWRRQLRYLGLLSGGRWDQCLRLAAVHNRQVQLALSKRQQRAAADPARRARLGLEVDVLRAAVKQARSMVTLAIVVAVGLVPGRRLEGQQTVWASIDELVNAAKVDIGRYWSSKLGAAYQPPTTVEPYSSASQCKPLKNNAVYCGRPRAIYYDPQFLDGQFRQIGDFAAVFVLAHEWGHLVQALNTGQPVRWQIQNELQADCYAGSYANDVNQAKRLDPGDVPEAIESLRRARDPVDYPWFDAQAHGSAGQRIDAFQEGLDGRPCEGDAFWRRIHLDASAAQQKSTPNSGSLVDHTTRKKGRFDLVEIHALPAEILGAVTDAIYATYRASDGVQVSLRRVAFADTTSASASFERSLSKSQTMGYTIADRGPVKDGEQLVGRWVRLMGTTEFVLTVNRQLVEGMEGPAGVAWEFATTAPTWQEPNEAARR